MDGILLVPVQFSGLGVGRRVPDADVQVDELGYFVYSVPKQRSKPNNYKSSEKCCCHIRGCDNKISETY